MFGRRFAVVAIATASIVVPLAATRSSAASIVQTFHGLTPARVLDTRPASPTVDDQYEGLGAIGPGETSDVPVTGRGGVPSSGVGSVAVNITVVNPTASGFVTAFARGDARPTASNLNFTPGLVVANMAIVAVDGSGSISLFNSAGSTDLVVDVLGWFPKGAAYTGLTPARLLDTRPGSPTIDGQSQTGAPLAAGAALDLPVLGRGGIPASGVGSVALNVTVAGSSAAGFVTVYPSGSGRPTASNLNFVAGQVVPNMVIVPVGPNGAITLFNSAGNTNLAVDVLGWFPDTNVYTGLTPARLLETRAGQPTVDGVAQAGGAAGPGGQIDLPVLGRGGVPSSGVGAVALNVTATGPTASTFITVFPTGATRPTASNINLVAGATVPNMVIVKVGTGGSVSLFNFSGSTDLIVDVLGWFPLDTSSGGTTATTAPGSPATTGPPFTIPLLVPGPTSLISVANNAPPADKAATQPSISGTGRFVAFQSAATNLVGTDNNARTDVFVRDTMLGTTKLVSVSTGGIQGDGNSDSPSISADGRFVVFHSVSTNLVAAATDTNGDVYIRDTTMNTTYEISANITTAADGNGQSDQPVISGNGTTIAFRTSSNNLGITGHNPGYFDVVKVVWNSLAHKVTTGVTATAAVVAGTAGDASQPTLNFDGTVIAWASDAQNLVAGDTNHKTDIYESGYTDAFILTPVIRASITPGAAQPNGDSTNPMLSGTGQLVVYQSDASNLLPLEDYDLHTSIFRYDAHENDNSDLSQSYTEIGPDGDSMTPAISRNGLITAFATDATNIVQGDTDGVRDIVVVGPNGEYYNGSITTAGAAANAASHNASLSATGALLAFDSTATNLGSDANAIADVFIHNTGAS